MRKIFLYVLFGLLGHHLMARQVTSSDSVYFYKQIARQVAWAHNSVTHLLMSTCKNTARSNLYAGMEKGAFRRSQEAWKQTTAGFHTEGIKSAGRFTLAGQFNFAKSLEDSTAWWNGGEYDAAQPYYFFAGKAGKSEQQLFDLSATAACNVWDNKLYFGLNGNYRYQWTTRSVDPRLDAKALAVILRPEITWRYKQHLIGAGISWGRGSDVFNIGYKNRDFAGNQTYIERNNFMSLGFGHIGKLDRNMQRYHETNGFFANYASRFNNRELQAGGGYELWQEDISIDQLAPTRNNHSLYAFLQQEKAYGKLLIIRSRNKNRQQWELNFKTQSMLNRASEFNATSYQYTANEAGITYRRQWQQTTCISFEAGAGGEYTDQYKEDAVTAHKHQQRVIVPHLYAGIYRQAANKNRLSFGLSPFYRYTLTNELSVPKTQENYFTQGVVYTDYLYWQKNSWGVASQFNFTGKENSKKYRLGCTVNIKWQQATDGSETHLPALYLPSGSRWSAGASLNLYL